MPGPPSGREPGPPPLPWRGGASAPDGGTEGGWQPKWPPPCGAPSALASCSAVSPGGSGCRGMGTEPRFRMGIWAPPRPGPLMGGGPAKRRPGSAGGRGGGRLGLCAPHDPALPGYLGALCVFTRCAAAGVAPVCSEQWSAPLGRVCLGQVCCRSGAKSLLL